MGESSRLRREADGCHRAPRADTQYGIMASCLTTVIMARAEGFVHDVPSCMGFISLTIVCSACIKTRADRHASVTHPPWQVAQASVALPGMSIAHISGDKALVTPHARCGPWGAPHRPAARLPWRGDALRQAHSCRSPETHLPLLFVHIDANIGHGWSPLCGMDRVMVCGAEATTCG